MEKLYLVLLILVAPMLSVAGESSISIGAVYSLTGYGAEQGLGELNATLLAVEDINMAGGVNGKELKLVFEDNRSTAKDTVSAFKKLINIHKVPVILGPNWVEFAEPVSQFAEDSGIVLLTSSAYSKKLTEGKDFIFTTMIGCNYMVEPLAQDIIAQKAEKIVLLVSNNPYFKCISDELIKQLDKHEIIEMVFDPEQRDYRSVITKLKTSDAKIVVSFLAEGGALFSFFKQAKDLELKKNVYSSNAIAYENPLLNNLQTAEGVIYFDYRSLASEEWEKRYEERFHKDMVYSGGQAYEDVWMLKWAMENCGEDSQGIKKCLKKIKHRGMTGAVSFDETNNVVGLENYVVLKTIKDGKIVAFSN